ncbi:uncharacterized protein LACBIDRAFT_329785 [Laccaria bicolor S238N-H82]|uniref:Predicted protein n=1 Tax=Laccaria bicolor (strain S238N-H82 / ATCC MYA-4686) TaxID=486041 RepID=B0DJ85_LACBS|nr:uncharacterized protein LACBIDRAFT_329785 [Laccaria bicolor S238N-H82]EDR05361.1 predicted protein [Laccaria bicolor S238N-H82]|eukprot:XP_001883919.1 predicted protein [Laccaria bicolor S238N-H82]
MKKQEDLVMGVTSRHLLAARIHFLDVNLEDEIKDVMVSHKFMVMRFGGSTQEITPNISKVNFDKHGFDNFMYCNFWTLTQWHQRFQRWVAFFSTLIIGGGVVHFILSQLLSSGWTLQKNVFMSNYGLHWTFTTPTHDCRARLLAEFGNKDITLLVLSYVVIV